MIEIPDGASRGVTADARDALSDLLVDVRTRPALLRARVNFVQNV